MTNKPLKFTDEHYAKIFAEVASLSTLHKIALQVIHEFNNPMTVIRANAERILQLAKDPNTSVDAYRKCAHKIQKMTQRTESIVKSIRALILHKNDVGPSQISIAHLFSDIKTLAVLLCKKSDIELQLHDVSEDLIVEADHNKVCQVLISLICHAIDEIGTTTSQRIEIRTEATNHTIDMKISFSSLAKTQDASSDIVLFLTKQMIEGLNGSFTFESTTKNKTFVISLRRFNPPAPYSDDDWEEI